MLTSAVDRLPLLLYYLSQAETLSAMGRNHEHCKILTSRAEVPRCQCMQETAVRILT